MCDSSCCTGSRTSITSTQGPKGDSATLSAGAVTTLAAGASATVTNTGTATAAVFAFGIPQGAQGESGETHLGFMNATASATLTEENSGAVIFLNHTEAVALTLPANPAVGSYYIFRCAQAPVAGYSIICPSGHKYLGHYFAKKASTADAIFTPNGTTNNTFSMNGTTTGGLVGTDLMILYTGAGRYHVSGQTYGSGSLATSFSG